MPADLRFPLLLLCFLLSGVAGLVYETAWTREFSFVFGTSNLAVATVLAAYMAGLATGAAVAARFAGRIRRPVLAYGVLELGIAVAALLVPLAISGARALYVALFGAAGGLPESGGLTTALFYLVASFLILMLPTAMMGATLPLLLRQAIQREDEIGRRTALLYAANTAGAVAGVVLAAFVLLPNLGLRQTIWSAALLNGVVFLAAWALSRASGPLRAEADETSRRAAVEPGRARWILPIMFVSGAVSFSYEVLWVRLLGHVVGSSLYAFATMLASFLAGIALGSALASRLAKTRVGATRDFSTAQLFIAGLALLAFVVVGWLPLLSQALQVQGYSDQLGHVLAGMLTLFPGAVVIGATFPLAVRILARDSADAASAGARVYAANTFGSIAGSVSAGFFVIPALGYGATITLLVATNLALAAAAALLLEPRRRALAATACAAVLAIALFPPEAPIAILRSSPMTGHVTQGEIEYLGVGRSATVMMVEDRARWFLRTNGLPEATIEPPNFYHLRSPLARWLTALPVLARPDARSIVVVGLGGGVAIETLPKSLERVDVIELEPEVVAANRAVADRRARDPLADPRVRVHVNDARNALFLTEERYDAIVSQPSHPWSSGASHLYTREFFELARDRLVEDGVFVQWIGLAFVDEDLFRSLLATLGEVFENVRVYLPPPMAGALFIASNGPLDVESSAARALAASREDFAEIGLRTPDDVTAWLVLDESGAREMAAGAPSNRDDHNLLHALSPRVGGQALNSRVDQTYGPYDPLPAMGLSGAQALYLMPRLPRARAVRLAASMGEGSDRRVAEAILDAEARKRVRAREALDQLLRESPRHAEARAVRLRLAAPQLMKGSAPLAVVPPPLSASETAVVEGWIAHGADDFATVAGLEPELAAIDSRDPLAIDATRLRAEWRIASGDPERAEEAIELSSRAIIDRGNPGDLLLRARACAAAGDDAAAMDTLSMLLPRTRKGDPLSRALAAEAARIVRGLVPREDLARYRSQLLQAFGSRAG